MHEWFFVLFLVKAVSDSCFDGGNHTLTCLQLGDRVIRKPSSPVSSSVMYFSLRLFSILSCLSDANLRHLSKAVVYIIMIQKTFSVSVRIY